VVVGSRVGARSGWGGDYPVRTESLSPGPAPGRWNSTRDRWIRAGGRWNSGGELAGDRGEGARVARAHVAPRSLYTRNMTGDGADD
jgi:hypothetical protein